MFLDLFRSHVPWQWVGHLSVSGAHQAAKSVLVAADFLCPLSANTYGIDFTQVGPHNFSPVRLKQWL